MDPHFLHVRSVPSGKKHSREKPSIEYGGKEIRISGVSGAEIIICSIQGHKKMSLYPQNDKVSMETEGLQEGSYRVIVCRKDGSRITREIDIINSIH